jgi:nucleoid-associated protein YgaU
MRGALRRRAALKSGVVVSLFLACSMTTFAQSLGDIARQERERKQDQPQRETHVYTNDDLERPHILVPEDQARALAARNRNGITPAATVQASEPPVPALPAPPSASPLSGASKTASIVSSPSPMQISSTDLPVSADRSHPQPRRSARSAMGTAPLPVRLGTARDESPSSDFAMRKRTSAFARQPEANSSQTTGVRVERGDSLWRLAAQHLGNGARWRELAKVNPELSDPNLIRAGAWIRLPSQDPQNARHIAVQSGDTLWSVAHAEFGSGLAFSCIADANPQLLSVDRIRAGEMLVLPRTCATAR